jgi:hypothetical protein
MRGLTPLQGLGKGFMEGKCNALLMADRIIREDNGKRGIIGSFNTFNFAAFPAQAPPFFIYANLEAFAGQHEFAVSIVREGAELVVFSAGGEIDFAPGQEAELIVPALGVVFPRPGDYNLILKIGNSPPFGSRRMIVNQIPQERGK